MRATDIITVSGANGVYEIGDAFPVFLCLVRRIVASAGFRVQSNCIAAAGKPQWSMYVALTVVGANDMFY